MRRAKSQKLPPFTPTFHQTVDQGFFYGWTAPELHLWIVLRRFADHKTRICYPSYDTIHELTGLNRMSIKRGIDRLVARGLIEVVKCNRKAGGKRNTYRLNLDAEKSVIDGFNASSCNKMILENAQNET